MTVLLILPVVIILATLISQAAGLGDLLRVPVQRADRRHDGRAASSRPWSGRVWLVAVALLASVPLGVAAALYLSEYAPDNWLTRVINLAIINLAGVPSIVHALFGVGRLRALLPASGTSILAASLTLADHDAARGDRRRPGSRCRRCPTAFREACWSMGATRWQTIRRVVLPNAVSGILTGVILEVSRTVGETAPIMFTGAAFFLPFLPQSVFDQTMALSLHLFVVSTQVPGVPEELPYGVALVLIGIMVLWR